MLDQDAWSPRAPEELKRRIPGAHIRLQFADPAELDTRGPGAARAAPATTRHSPCGSPSDGGVRSLRDLLDRLGDGVAVEDLSIHTPDLDDVFFLALTGTPFEGAHTVYRATIATQDSTTMLARELKHTLRYPLMLIASILSPVVLLLLFVYILGGPISSGLGDAARGGAYVDFLVPGILMMSGGGRFVDDRDQCVHRHDRRHHRPVPWTMAVSRGAVLTGHVAASVLRTLVTTTVITAVALLVGFRPKASIVDWLIVVGIVVAFSFALAWFSAALGLGAKTVAGANSATLPIQFLLPFLSSAFVPADSMPVGVRWFTYQPFTPVVDSLQALLSRAPVGNTIYLALAWCAVIALAGYLWARACSAAAPDEIMRTAAGELVKETERMITIGQLAEYAGVTIKAVRHYHQRGLLPEPPRDSSGAGATAPSTPSTWSRSKTLAEAGVPLAASRSCWPPPLTGSPPRSSRSTATCGNRPRNFNAPRADRPAQRGRRAVRLGRGGRLPRAVAAARRQPADGADGAGPVDPAPVDLPKEASIWVADETGRDRRSGVPRPSTSSTTRRSTGLRTTRDWGHWRTRPGAGSATASRVAKPARGPGHRPARPDVGRRLLTGVGRTGPTGPAAERRRSSARTCRSSALTYWRSYRRPRRYPARRRHSADRPCRRSTQSPLRMSGSAGHWRRSGPLSSMNEYATSWLCV